VVCAGAVDTCVKCAHGHDPTEDKKSCKERAESIIQIGKGHYNSDIELLKPNGVTYVAHPRVTSRR